MFDLALYDHAALEGDLFQKCLTLLYMIMQL